MLNQRKIIGLRLLIFLSFGLAGLFAVGERGGPLCEKVYLSPGTISVLDKPTLSFMTFNVRTFGMQSRPDLFDLKATRIANIIRENRPDFIVLQEIMDVEGLRRLSWDYLRGLYRWEFFKGVEGNVHHLAFLIRKDLKVRYQIRSFINEQWLDPVSKKEFSLFPKDLPTLIVWDRDTFNLKPLFIFIGVHAKARIDRYGDPQSETLRNAQFVRINIILERLTNEFGNEVPIILGGDFNVDLLPLQNSTYSIFRGMTDAFNSPAMPSRPQNIDRITHVTFHNGALLASQLDGFFIGKNHRHAIVETKVIPFRRSQEGRTQLPSDKKQWKEMPSDHFPVLLRIRSSELMPSVAGF